MKILAFDTVNNSASVAISEDKIILAYIEDLRPSMQAETIVPMIEEALRIAKLSYHDLNYLAVINGPGSFTGIRVGLSVAKGILLSTNIIGTTISNFEYCWWRASRQVSNHNKNVIRPIAKLAYAEEFGGDAERRTAAYSNVREDSSTASLSKLPAEVEFSKRSIFKFFIFLNAYRGQLYSQVFDQDGQASIPLLIDYDQAVQLLNIEDNIIKVCVGSGVGMIYDKIKDFENVIILPRFSRVKAWHICQYIVDKIARKYNFSNSIEPLYIRLADVKIKHIVN